MYPMTDQQFTSLLNPAIDAIESYIPINPLEVLSERLSIAIEDIVKLDANENPYGPIPAVNKALANYPRWHIYPDPQSKKLRTALAAFVGVDSAMLLPGHGADELLDILCRIFLSPADAVINVPPTFGMYSFDAKLQGADVINIARDADYAIKFDDIARQVHERAQDANSRPVKLVFLTSPNNPTGNCLSDADLQAALALPVIVVLDEAYVEFSDAGSRADWVDHYPNLIVLRTFSKAAGIAGLRLGYGVFPRWLMPTLWKFKQPYNVNVAASVAGCAALDHVDQIEAVVTVLKNERERLYRLLEPISLLETVPRSQANFILCNVRGLEAANLQRQLELQGILVRHYAKAGLENCIRISVGRPTDTDTLIHALRKIADEL